ncbi:MAG: hypothetical protein H6674_07845 [Dehalococcoidia bacterium]|nr:hypothetical protein [Dehalococcoidia bacterium]
MTTLQFRSEDARIVYLATIFHLGRPGSETDPNTPSGTTLVSERSTTTWCRA